LNPNQNQRLLQTRSVSQRSALQLQPVHSAGPAPCLTEHSCLSPAVCSDTMPRARGRCPFEVVRSFRPAERSHNVCGVGVATMRPVIPTTHTRPSPNTPSRTGDTVQPLFPAIASDVARTDQEVVELPLLLPRWQAVELEAVARRRGMTT